MCLHCPSTYKNWNVSCTASGLLEKVGRCALIAGSLISTTSTKFARKMRRIHSQTLLPPHPVCLSLKLAWKKQKIVRKLLTKFSLIKTDQETSATSVDLVQVFSSSTACVLRKLWRHLVVITATRCLAMTAGKAQFRQKVALVSNEGIRQGYADK